MNTRTLAAIAISTMLLAGACRSIEKLIDQGRYDETLALAQKKMTGKSERKHKYVIAAEQAFAKVTSQDMERIERLQQRGTSEDWQQVVVITQRIERRQRALQPFLPLISDQGYQAKFNFVKTDEVGRYAEDQLVSELYEEGNRLLTSARNGDRQAGQMAYDRFSKLLQRSPTYRDVTQLRDESRQLGMIHVYVTVDNRAYRYMPGYVADALEEQMAMTNAFWVQYHLRPVNPDRMDYEARLVVTAIEVGPEVVREERLDRKKKIEDGWEYVLDNRGNVAKDSLGNDIRKTKYREVTGYVILTHQEKAAYMNGTLELVDLKNAVIAESRSLRVETRFYHQGQTFFGDERALEKKDKVFIAPIPFPTNEGMMLDVAKLMPPAYRNELEKCRQLRDHF